MNTQAFIRQEDLVNIQFARELIEEITNLIVKQKVRYYNQAKDFAKKRIRLFISQLNTSLALRKVYEVDIKLFVYSRLKQLKRNFNLLELV